MTHLPQDLIDRCAKAILREQYELDMDNPEHRQEAMEHSMWSEAQRAATACLTEAGAWLGQAPDTQPGFPARALRCFDDPRPAGRD